MIMKTIALFVSLLLFVPSLARPPTLFLGSPTTTIYYAFLGDVRQQAQNFWQQYFGIPVLPAPSPTPTPQYIWASLIIGKANITLALRRSDLYVMGYSDVVATEGRAFFLKGAPETDEAREKLFPDVDAHNRFNLTYRNSYREIQAAAEVVDRRTFGLGMKKLANLVHKTYGADLTGPNFSITQARMLLVAIQTVCEAARFTYIEGQIRSPPNFEAPEFIPNHKVISYQDRWVVLSKAIRGAEPFTGNFKNPVSLYHPDGTKYNVTMVVQVKIDIGLLKYVDVPNVLQLKAAI